MSLQKSIVSRLMESKHLPDDLPISEVRLSETVVVGGNWYWKSKGTCWTQPTDKSSPRKEIDEEEYRDACAKAKNGVYDMSDKKPRKKSTKRSNPAYNQDVFRNVLNSVGLVGWTQSNENGFYLKQGVNADKTVDAEIASKFSKSHEALSKKLEELGYKESSKKTYVTDPEASGEATRGMELTVSVLKNDEGEEVSVVSRTGGKSFGHLINVSRDYELPSAWIEKKSGDTPDKKDKSTEKSADLPSARDDFYGPTNTYHVGRQGNFEKDMRAVSSKEPGVTAKLVYGDKTTEYARKVAPNTWKTDTGMTLSDNDIVTVAHDGGKATINSMIKSKVDNTPE